VVVEPERWEMQMFQEFRERLHGGRLICPFCGESSLALSASDGELDPPLPEAAHGQGGMLLVHTSSERVTPTPIPDPHANRRVEVYCENHYCRARDFVIADTALAKPWPSEQSGD
jgi:hypothetical protein